MLCIGVADLSASIEIVVLGPHTHFLPSRRFAWTLNNPTDVEIKIIKDHATRFTYLVYGHEKGESGTHHLQGYFEVIYPNPNI